MRASPFIATALAAITLPLSACGAGDFIASSMSTTTSVTATVTQIPGATPPVGPNLRNGSHEWAGGKDGTGVFTVGDHPKDGISVAIPPGHYQVKLAPGAQDGSWMLCDTALCGPAFQRNASIVGHPIAPYSSAVYIGPRSRTLWVDHVVLTPSSD